MAAVSVIARRRGSLPRWLAGLVVLLAALPGQRTWAQTPVRLAEPAPGDVSVADAVDAPSGRRSYLQAAMTKVRPDSFLKQTSLPVPQGPELRGSLGRRRDELLSRHYARLAELDALADEASRHRDLRVAEQVETARRRDTQQFFLTMQALKVQTLAAWAAGGR